MELLWNYYWILEDAQADYFFGVHYLSETYVNGYCLIIDFSGRVVLKNVAKLLSCWEYDGFVSVLLYEHKSMTVDAGALTIFVFGFSTGAATTSSIWFNELSDTVSDACENYSGQAS